MKKIFYSLLSVCAITVSVMAQPLSNPVISSWNGSTPNSNCGTLVAFTTGNMTQQPIGPLGSGSCANHGCTPYNFVGGYETMTFKNSNATNTVCYTIDYDGTTTTQLVGFTLNGSYTANMTCPVPGFTDNGSYFLNQPTVNSWDFDVPACSEFTVVTWEFGNPGPYQFTITPQSGSSKDAAACVGTECIQYLTIGGTPVPTMTQWGLFLFGLILLTMAVVTVYNLSRKTQKP